MATVQAPNESATLKNIRKNLVVHLIGLFSDQGNATSYGERIACHDVLQEPHSHF